MKKIFFFNILVYFLGFIILNSLTTYSLAMSKRPKIAKQANSEKYVLPEIEIISQPEANRQLLMEDHTKSTSRINISPAEVLPAVGKDAKIAAKGFRTIDVQRALKNNGFKIGSIDGKIGPKTKKAIQEFQKENNLTVDGIVGKKTWAALKIYLNQNKKNNSD